MTGADLAAIEARIRAFESRTGVEAVVVDRSDRYHGLRWRAFAVGASLAALGVVVADETAVTSDACAPVQSGRRTSRPSSGRASWPR